MDFVKSHEQVTKLVQGSGGGLMVILGLLLALVQCFFGYRLFRYLVTFIGFIVFAALGYSIGVPIAGSQSEIAFAVAVVLGLVGGFLAFKFYKVGVFLQCFLAGFILGASAGLLLGWSNAQALALAIVAGVLLGLIGVVLIKPLVIFSTGISGGMQTGLTLAALVKINYEFGILLGCVLAVCGIAYQIYEVRKAGKKAKDSQPHEVAEVPEQSAEPANAVEAVIDALPQESAEAAVGSMPDEIAEAASEGMGEIPAEHGDPGADKPV